MSFFSARNNRACELFDGIARDYEWPAQALSFFQYLRWRRDLVSRLALTDQALVLDVCSGPGGVTMAIAREKGCRVIGVDLSGRMVAQAQRNVSAAGLLSKVSIVHGQAERLPFADGAFDAMAVTFLLRYVDSPQRTLMELSRVLRPGGRFSSLEFFIPQGPFLYPLWLLHTRLALPMAAWPLSAGWRKVGAFLGPSISRFYTQHSLVEVEQMWARAGMTDVRSKKLSLGGAVVTWGVKHVAQG